MTIQNINIYPSEKAAINRQELHAAKPIAIVRIIEENPQIILEAPSSG
jgi:hypothetical protein